MPLSVHKKKQGMILRWGFFITAVCLAIFAAYRLFVSFPYLQMDEKLRPEFWQFFYQELVKFTVPLIDIPMIITPRLLIAFGIGIGMILLLVYLAFMNIRISEFMIDTESEMRKVAWPTKGEVLDSSLVVVIVIVALGVYLFVIDILLNKIFHFIFF